MAEKSVPLTALEEALKFPVPMAYAKIVRLVNDHKEKQCVSSS
jgi:hypothetical protein